MMSSTPLPEEDSRRLDLLFQSYRDACAVGEGSPNFMPLLWQRIEARRSNALFTQRVARVFATATLALAVVAGVAMSFEPQGLYDDTWVETIANHNLEQNAAYYEPVRLSPVSDRQ